MFSFTLPKHEPHHRRGKTTISRNHRGNYQFERRPIHGRLNIVHVQQSDYTIHLYPGERSPSAFHHNLERVQDVPVREAPTPPAQADGDMARRVRRLEERMRAYEGDERDHHHKHAAPKPKKEAEEPKRDEKNVKTKSYHERNHHPRCCAPQGEKAPREGERGSGEEDHEELEKEDEGLC